MSLAFAVALQGAELQSSSIVFGCYLSSCSWTRRAPTPTCSSSGFEAATTPALSLPPSTHSTSNHDNLGRHSPRRSFVLDQHRLLLPKIPGHLERHSVICDRRFPRPAKPSRSRSCQHVEGRNITLVSNGLGMGRVDGYNIRYLTAVAVQFHHEQRGHGHGHGRRQQESCRQGWASC